MKIKIPNEEYIEVIQTEIVKSGNGAVAKARKKYIGHDAVILVKKMKPLTDNEVARKWAKRMT